MKENLIVPFHVASSLGGQVLFIVSNLLTLIRNIRDGIEEDWSEDITLVSSGDEPFKQQSYDCMKVLASRVLPKVSR